MSAHTKGTAVFSPADLGDEIRGTVIGPDDERYDTARALNYSQRDDRPAVIIRAAGVEDVSRAVILAQETGLELAVRSGGHSGAGHSCVDGGIVIDLRDMTAVDFDLSNRTAWAETGITAGEFSKAAAEHGLAIGFGDTGSVGIGGLTLGGGVGYLARKHGLTIDNLLAVELVTADGQLRHVDADSEPDLFWALRGGGGNFGVATRFQFQLQPLDQVIGGILVLPATTDTVAGFMAAAEAASEDLTTIANVMNCPPLPFVPEDQHGSLVIMGLICFAGEISDGDEALRPFRELATPLADLLRPMPYPEIFPPDDPDYHPTAVALTMFLDRVDREVAATIVKRLEASDASLRVVQLRALGGAISRVDADATAYAHRDSRIMANVAAFYDGPEDRVRRQAWVDDLAAELRQNDRGAYVNFIGDEGAERVKDAYPPATWERLAAVKAKHDPGNLFRRNQNIPPRGAAEPAS